MVRREDGIDDVTLDGVAPGGGVGLVVRVVQALRTLGQHASLDPRPPSLVEDDCS